MLIFYGCLHDALYKAITEKNEKREGSMYQRKLEKDIRCPLEYGMELFGGKCNSRIICVLAALGTLRYS